MKISFIYRNRVVGFLFGKYNLQSETKKVLNKGEEYVSGIEITKFNESIYILAIISIFVILILSLYSPYILLLLILIPIFFLFAFTLQLVILTNDRLIIMERSVLQRIFRIENELSIALDKIIILSYSRAPLHRYALGFGVISIILTYYLIPPEILSLDILQLFPILLIMLIPSIYLFWIGLRLSKRSIEISIFGIPNPIGIGREKGIPLWFVYDLQMLVFGYIQYSSPLKLKGSMAKEEFEDEDVLSLKELLDRTPYEIHKKILLSLKKKPLQTFEIINALSNYPRSDINKGIDELRKKRFIFYIRKYKEWSINYSPEIGIRKKISKTFRSSKPSSIETGKDETAEKETESQSLAESSLSNEPVNMESKEPKQKNNPSSNPTSTSNKLASSPQLKATSAKEPTTSSPAPTSTKITSSSQLKANSAKVTSTPTPSSPSEGPPTPISNVKSVKEADKEKKSSNNGSKRTSNTDSKK